LDFATGLKKRKKENSDEIKIRCPGCPENN
jgi:hypothetical protein